jgi:hypothetical protein
MLPELYRPLDQHHARRDRRTASYRSRTLCRAPRRVREKAAEATVLAELRQEYG